MTSTLVSSVGLWLTATPPPPAHSSLAQVAAAIEPEAPPQPPDVFIDRARKACTITDEAFARLMKEQQARLEAAVAAGYRDLPIDRERFAADLSAGLTPHRVCLAVNPQRHPTTAQAYDRLRSQYLQAGMSAETGAEYGVISGPVPISFEAGRCRDEAIRSSSAYVNVDGCEHLAKLINGKRPMVAIYAVDLPAVEAQALFQDPKNLPKVKKYANGGPTACSNNASFHLLAPTALRNLAFANQEYSGEGWFACHLLKACTGLDGQVHRGEDLRFLNAARTFLQLDVQDSDRGVPRPVTLIMTVTAAIHNLGVLGDLGEWIGDPAERFISGEAAKKFFAERHALDGTPLKTARR